MFYIIALLGVVLMILSAFYPTNGRLAKRYKGLPFKELERLRIFSEKIKILGLVIIFVLMPILAGFIFPQIEGTSSWDFVFGFFILALAGAIYLWGLNSRITKLIDAEKE